MRDRCDAEIGDGDHKSKTFLSGLSSSYNQAINLTSSSFQCTIHYPPPCSHLTFIYSIFCELHCIGCIRFWTSKIHKHLLSIIIVYYKKCQSRQKAHVCNSLPNNISSCLLSVFPRPPKQQISAGKSMCGLHDTVLVVYNSSA